MRSIQNLILFIVFALAMVGCKKDGQLISPTNTSNNKIVTEVSSNNHTHTSKRKCASKEYMEQKLQDPTYRAEHEKCMAAFERNIKSRSVKSRSACTTPTILPVAVHYQGISNPNKACLIQTAKDAIAVLNADFQGKNGDIVQWDNTASQYYPGISNGDACVGFQLGSKNHPAGFDLQDGDLAITINKTTSDENNDWAGYINIFVGDADGNLGYAPLGGNGQGDGMVIAQGAFAIGTTCGSVQGTSPNDLGRTLTHEMGHYLNLDHVWGDGGCSADDQVSDTPIQDGPNYGCPTLGSTKACNSEALHMNFMDYADDACMYMFSAGQAARVEAWVNSGLLNNLKKASDVFGDTDGGDTDGGDTDGGDTDGGDTDGGDTDGGDTDGGDTDGGDTDGGDTDGGDTDGGDTDGGDTDGGDTDGGDTDGGDTDGGDTDGGDTDGGDTDGGDTDGGDTDGGDTDEEGNIEINVTLDNFGSETSFAIEDGDGEILEIWGPFEDGVAGTQISVEVDLPTGFYTFVIMDDFGDGICCYEGNGNWNLAVDGNEIHASNGEFGDWEAVDFVIGNARLKAPAYRKATKDLVKLAKKQKPSTK